MVTRIAVNVLKKLFDGSMQLKVGDFADVRLEEDGYDLQGGLA